jgi:hypothetical protein
MAEQNFNQAIKVADRAYQALLPRRLSLRHPLRGDNRRSGRQENAPKNPNLLSNNNVIGFVFLILCFALRCEGTTAACPTAAPRARR